jgi:hypothetical protein
VHERSRLTHPADAQGVTDGAGPRKISFWKGVSHSSKSRSTNRLRNADTKALPFRAGAMLGACFRVKKSKNFGAFSIASPRKGSGWRLRRTANYTPANRRTAYSAESRLLEFFTPRQSPSGTRCNSGFTHSLLRRPHSGKIFPQPRPAAGTLSNLIAGFHSLISGRAFNSQFFSKH